MFLITDLACALPFSLLHKATSSLNPPAFHVISATPTRPICKVDCLQAWLSAYRILEYMLLSSLPISFWCCNTVLWEWILAKFSSYSLLRVSYWVSIVLGYACCCVFHELVSYSLFLAKPYTHWSLCRCYWLFSYMSCVWAAYNFHSLPILAPVSQSTPEFVSQLTILWPLFVSMCVAHFSIHCNYYSSHWSVTVTEFFTLLCLRFVVGLFFTNKISECICSLNFQPMIAWCVQF